MFSGIVVSCDSGINIRTDCYNWIGSNDSSAVEKAKLNFCVLSEQLYVLKRKLNIEKIDLPSGSFNTIICNHVLEHVSDRQALAEISRILSAEGFFIVSVPIIEGWEHTYENDSIKDPLLRELHFGQSDHARYYGRDFRDRLKDAGFNKIEEVTSEGQNVMDYGLLRGEKFFVCSKG